MDTAIDTKPTAAVPNGSTKRAARVRSDFPKFTLEDAVRVPQVIEDANAGQPYPPLETAIALGLSPRNSDFEQIVSASLKYGLTQGSSRAERIALDSLGRSVVAPVGEADRAAALFRAAFTPPTFKGMYDFYRGKKLPEKEYLANAVVREFGVPKEHAELCTRIFQANLQFLGLLREASGARYLSSDGPAAAVSSGTGDAHLATADEPEAQHDGGDGVDTSKPTEPPPSPERPERPKAIFVGHGKNRKPLDHVTRTLDQFKVPYKVAVDEPNRGRPISQKVADTMKECGAAILIFTADQEYRDLEGNPIWKASENVAHELGAASVEYGGRIIVFKEASVDFPTNYKDIGYIEFDNTDLSGKVMNELFRELIDFGLVKLSVA